MFRRLAFDLGTVRDARFMPDGQSVIYGAAWNGDPLRIFMTRTDSQESVRLSLPDARVLSISKSGEMAISLGHTFEGWMGMGTLARSSMLGSAPRVLLENIREAEWSPDGAELAIVRRVGGLEQLEFPAGHVLYKSSGFISDIRFSPDGTRIAFADHPLFADDAGAVSMVDRAGQRTVLWDGFISVRGLAWSADGTEIWFTGTRGGVETAMRVYAVTPAGRQRVVMASPAGMKLYDIAPDGRVLLGVEMIDRRVEALLAGSTEPRNVAIRESSTSQWLSQRRLAPHDLRSDDAALHRLRPAGGRRRAGRTRRRQLVRHLARRPLGARAAGDGRARAAASDRRRQDARAAESRIAALRHRRVAARQPPRRPVRPAGGQAWTRICAGHRGRRAASVHRGRRDCAPVVVAAGRARWEPRDRARRRRRAGVLPRQRRAHEPVPGLRPGELPIRFSEDGRALLVARGNGLPWVVERMDIATGRRTPAIEIRAREAAGLRLSIIDVTPDARHYVHSYSRLLTDLFVVKGLK